MINKVDCLTSNTDTIYLFCTIIYISILFIFLSNLALFYSYIMEGRSLKNLILV